LASRRACLRAACCCTRACLKARYFMRSLAARPSVSASVAAGTLPASGPSPSPGRLLPLLLLRALLLLLLLGAPMAPPWEWSWALAVATRPNTAAGWEDGRRGWSGGTTAGWSVSDRWGTDQASLAVAVLGVGQAAGGCRAGVLMVVQASGPLQVAPSGHESNMLVPVPCCCCCCCCCCCSLQLPGTGCALQCRSHFWSRPPSGTCYPLPPSLPPAAASLCTVMTARSSAGTMRR
jgi:hypothetical protein